MNSSLRLLRVAPLTALACLATLPALAQSNNVLTGQAAFTDYSKQQPGVTRKLTVADLPPPYATEGVDNGADMVRRPKDAWPRSLPGFKVEQYYTGLDQPRLIRTAPNGDLFVGIRNCVGEAINPATGQLWCSTNERDMLGDNLVPDYITHVQEGGFYGWPWFYMGDHWDPRLQGKHPELKDKVITPDVLLQPHFASLQMTFYEGSQFPASYKGDAFAAEHGSWNKAKRAGYEVIMVPMRDGEATGAYEDFLTGFTTPDGKVWGRPVGVTVANDGSLFVTDDGSGSIWHVSYVGK